MNIIIGNDHGAVDLKNSIISHLQSKGYTVKNMGVDSTDSVDYPDIAEITCTEYKKGGYDFGILCCGTGIGISIAANKIKGIRCALPQNIFASKMAKAHNNVQFLAFGGRIDYPESVNDMIDEFIRTEFEGSRHGIRVDKIMDIELSNDNC
ncbi:MAG: RpiB/LacA/LacB family sugar-phosphate isomerase [Spirochaetes bacterium]|nr:RpiB/LacA/LacB family sugar-phosphate isomerase [Spirochaetota bacterium]